MKFEPLAYVWGTITVWHFVIWVTLTALVCVIVPMLSGDELKLASMPVLLWLLATAYAIFAVMIGQIFGDKYDFLQILPSGFLLIAAFMMLPIVAPLLQGRAEDSPPIALVVIALPFFGLFGATFMWLAPRIVGFGLVEIPKMPWGVSL